MAEGIKSVLASQVSFKPLLGFEPMATFRPYVCMYVCMYVCLHLCMFAIVAITKVNVKCTIRAESRRSQP